MILGTVSCRWHCTECVGHHNKHNRPLIEVPNADGLCIAHHFGSEQFELLAQCSRIGTCLYCAQHGINAVDDIVFRFRSVQIRPPSEHDDEPKKLTTGRVPGICVVDMAAYMRLLEVKDKVRAAIK